MTYKLFIDDERFPPKHNWWKGFLHWFYNVTFSPTLAETVIVRNSKQAVNFVRKNGMPSFISFDHDLGLSPDGSDDTSMAFLSWLEDELIEGRVTFPQDFDYYVHSQNPIGKQNIIGKMEALLNHFVRDAQFKGRK